MISNTFICLGRREGAFMMAKAIIESKFFFYEHKWNIAGGFQLKTTVLNYL